MARLLTMVLFATVIILPACKLPTSTPARQTFATLADAGQSVYADSCAVCHGNNGQPSDKFTVLLWSANSTPGTYHGIPLFTDAGGMLDYMKETMPLQSPGSLTDQQYIELLAYILVQTGSVSPMTVFDPGQLGSISIP